MAEARRLKPRIAIAGAEEYAARAARAVAEAIEAAYAERGGCSIALAGGSTPKPVYDRLAADPAFDGLPWERLRVFYGDERCVPPDDPRSNHRMAREALLSRRPIPAERIHPMPGEREDRHRAATEYTAILPDRIDLVLLGVGADGHTASLFPGSSALAAREPGALAVRSDADPPWRITVTPPVIELARRVIVLARGADKAVPIARALTGSWDPVRTPAQLARSGFWILDREAASALPESLIHKTTVDRAGDGLSEEREEK